MAPDRLLKILKNLPAPQQTQMDQKKPPIMRWATLVCQFFSLEQAKNTTWQQPDERPDVQEVQAHPVASPRGFLSYISAPFPSALFVKT